MILDEQKQGTQKFIKSIGHNIFQGLEQELGLIRGVHYHAVAHNSKRVATLSLKGFPPKQLGKLLKMREIFTIYSGLPESMAIRMTWGANRTAILEFPKLPAHQQGVSISDLNFSNNGYLVPLGLDTQDKQVNLDFNNPIVTHALLAGQTQSGKTNALLYLLWALTRDLNPNTKIIVFDVVKHGLNFKQFSNHPSLLCPVATNINEANYALSYIKNLMDTGNPDFEKVFIFGDELKYLISDLDNSIDVFSRVTELGAQMGLHAIFATQYPQLKLLSGQSGMVNNCTTRLAGKVINAANSSNALGLPNLGAETLTGFGDFIISNHEAANRFVFPKFDESMFGDYSQRSFSNLPDFDQDNMPQDNTVTFEPESKAVGRPINLYSKEDVTSMFLIAKAGLSDNNGKYTYAQLKAAIAEKTGHELSNRDLQYFKDLAKSDIRKSYIQTLAIMKSNKEQTD